MKPEALEEALRDWGHVYGQHAPKEWQEDCSLTGTHPIATAMEYARSGKDKSVSVAWRRKRSDSWRDPIVCTETRPSGSHAVLAGGMTRGSPMAEQVQQAALALYRQDTMRGVVLRAQYCTRGTQSDKAMWVTAQGFPVKLRVYREALSYAKGWVGARLAG